MDKSLNWNIQVAETCKKVFSLIHSFRRLKNFLPFSMKKMLVQTLVMPHFDYCDILLTDLSVTSAQRLQRVHNVCIRFICNTRKFDHITPSLQLLSWVRLKERRTIHSLSLLFRIMHTSTPNYLLSRFQFLTTLRNRHQALLSIPHHRTSLYSSSYTVEIPRLWNSLPNDVRDCRTLSQFKIKLENFVLFNDF